MNHTNASSITPSGDEPRRPERRSLASTDSYRAAESIVDRLADDGFPVEHIAIVGHDLRYVEQITGHLTRWKAALGGAGTGAVMGLLFGLLFGWWFAHDGTSMLALVAYWTGFGALIGASIGLVAHLATGGRRDFASVAGTQATRFEVLVDADHAEEAQRRLANAGGINRHAER